MAGKPFKLSIVSDVSDVVRGNKDIEGSFDEVADSLDDLARESRDAGRDVARGLGDGADDAARDVDDATDKIGRSLESTGDEARDAGRDIERHMDDAAREGDKAAEKLERSFKEAFDEVKGEARTSTRQVADDTRVNFDEAGNATETFRDEARSNLSETVSSFRGELEDIPQLFQDILGGVSADLGPAGAIGTIFAAAGLGLAVKFYEDWKEQAENVEQRISDMYDDMLESGQDYLSEQFLNTQISDILNSAEEAVIGYQRAQEIAAATGLDLTTVVRGYAGEAQAAQQVQDALNEKIAQAEREFTAAAEGGNAFGEALQSDAPRLEGYRDTLAEVSGNIATAAERAEVYRGAQLTSTEAVRDHIAALADFDDTLKEARDAIAENNEEIENGSARARENEGVLSDLAGAMLEMRDSAREAGGSTAELTALQLEQAGQFLDTARAAGIEEDAALDLARQLGLIPDNVVTDIRERGARHVIDEARAVAAAARATADGEYRVDFGVRLPSRRELQEQLNALVWSLNAPTAQVRVRYGQSIE